MVMGQQEPIEPSKAGAAAQQLALRPFSAVDEDAMAPRLHQKARMVAFSRWNARRRPQEGEREHGGPTSLPLSVVVVEDAHALVFSDETVSWSGRLPLRPGRRLLRGGIFCRLLAGDRHQHFLLAGGCLARLLGRLLRRLGLDRGAATLRRSASIRSTTLLAAGRSTGVMGLPERLLLMRSTSAVS